MFAQRLVVVGIDGSDGGRRALAWALEHAGRTGATVEIVTAYLAEDPAHPGLVAAARDRADEAQQRDVASALLAVPAPPVVAREVVRGDAVSVLAGVSRDAEMLVVGSHGRTHVRTALLGSVSAGCIRAATCPVVVVPTPKSSPRQREVATRARRL